MQEGIHLGGEWEEVGEGKISCFDNFYHPLHFMFDFYKGLTYRRLKIEGFKLTK